MPMGEGFDTLNGTNGNIDQELLRSFVAEVKSYLPEILRGVVDFYHNPRQLERLEEPHRYVHTIKGASAMVGLSALSEIALQLEEAFENIAAGQVLLTEEVIATFGQAVTHLGTYLENAAAGQLEIPHDLTEAMRSLSRLQGVLGGGGHVTIDITPTPIITSPASPGSLGSLDSFGSAEPADSGAQWQPDTESDIPIELLEIFLPEAEEYLRDMSTSLPLLAEQPGDRERLQDIRRNAHSLKGSAATVGFHEVARLAHRMEDMLDLLYEGGLRITPERMQLLFDSTDALEDMLDGKADEQRLSTIYEAYEGALGFSYQSAQSEQSGQSGTSEALARRDGPTSSAKGQVAPGNEALESERGQLNQASAKKGRGQFVRLPIESLDEVVKLVTELIITRASFEQNMSQLARQLEELRGSSTRLGRVSSKMEVQYEASTLGGGLALRKPFLSGGAPVAAAAAAKLNSNAYGFDDLEFDRYTEFHLLLRGLTEASGDIQTLDRELVAVKDDFDSCLNRQGRLCSDIQDKLMRMRMAPLSTLSTRLHRAIRTVASQRGKQVRFVIEGEETRLDKTVIEEMADPIAHILRNAIDHGIELSAVRQAKGKPAAGTIRLRAFYEGTQIIIQISDDGAGLNAERLRMVAINNGFLSNIDAVKMTEEDLYSLIFLPGFSTAPEISEISGRGVGLDVVKVAIHRMKGSVRVDSKSGQGTVFTVRLPMTMAVMRALMVRTCNQTFAVPLTGLNQVVRLDPQTIERINQEQVVRTGGKVYPLLQLGKLLNLNQSVDRPVERPDGAQPALLMNIEDRLVAIAVDESLGGREIVVKNLGNHLRQIRGVTGATLLGDGSAVLILNMPELIRDAFQPRMQLLGGRAKPAPTARKTPTVMVVDDSLSVRRVLSNLLSGVGWRPVQAKDGLDALELLMHLPLPPDVVLLDIEMPRMDGYEFISTLRKQKAYDHLPIVVLTSRAGQKHRDKAFEVGATDYMVKPYQDEALLDLIRRLINPSEDRGSRGEDRGSKIED